MKPAAGPVDGTVCQQLFSELLTKGKIRFAAKRADIDPDSAGILDHLIETALRCPTTNIEVAGHTDSTARMPSIRRSPRNAHRW